jgi:hypothetical protein
VAAPRAARLEKGVMYLIPTGKPGQFRTGPVPGLALVERTAFGRVGARLEKAAP